MISPIDRLKRTDQAPPTAPPEAPVESATHALFEQPLSVDAIEIPFRDTTPRPAAAVALAFYRTLKTHFRGRFLCNRGAKPRGP